MLYQLGPVMFEVVAPNLHEIDRKASADFAAKQLVGRRRSHEFVGEGEEQLSLRGRLFPERFGGMSALAALDAMRSSGMPYLLVRGDGRNLGWFLIESVRERHQHLGRGGVGRMVEFDIALTREDAPAGDAYMGALFSLFG